MTGTVRDVRGLADDLLFPDAMRVDGLDVLPVAHLDALAAAGLYGAPVPAEAGGREDVSRRRRHTAQAAASLSIVASRATSVTCRS